MISFNNKRMLFIFTGFLIISVAIAFNSNSTNSTEDVTDENSTNTTKKPEIIFCNCSTIGCNHPDNTLPHQYHNLPPFVCATKGGCQKSKMLTDTGVLIDYQCVAGDMWEPIGKPIPCQRSELTRHENAVGCCNNGHFCNQDLKVEFESKVEPSTPNPTVRRHDQTPDGLHIGLFIGIGCFLVMTLLVGFYLCKKRVCWTMGKHTGPTAELKPFLQPGDANMLIQLMFDDQTSGSGSGLPLLVQRTVARSIELQSVIGKGRFGEVWLGHWKTDRVAVKIFSSRDEKSWFREVEIYETTMLHHENILRFIAADNKDSGISTQLFLVTEYHPHGSLYDYLQVNTISDISLCTMIRSIANGLSYLHSEITGTKNKPGIAHRDLKTKNILVRTDGSCCIADLGLAVRYDASLGTIDIPNNTKVGTKRYLAPEVLDNSMNMNQFENYRRADIYALGLVIWEVCRRCDVGGKPLPYEPPYHDAVSPDPSLEEMRKCVCDEGKRPTIPNPWNELPILRDMSRYMRECWTSRPDARLTAMRVKKSVDALTASLANPLKLV